MSGEDDSELEEFADFLGKNERPPEEEPVATGFVSLAKEFRCLPCGRPFSRKDCKNDSGGVFVSIKKCPFCKSELVVRQKESGWAAARKYDIDPAETILGPKPGKYAGLAAKRAFQSGKITRKR